MRYINKYEEFITESSNSIEQISNEPGDKFKKMLDNNLESLVVLMGDEGYRVTLSYEIVDEKGDGDFYYSVNISEEMPSIEKFNQNVLSEIELSDIKSLKSNGNISVVFDKQFKYNDKINNTGRITTFRNLMKDTESKIKDFIQYAIDYEFFNVSHNYKDHAHIQFGLTEKRIDEIYK